MAGFGYRLFVGHLLGQGSGKHLGIQICLRVRQRKGSEIFAVYAGDMTAQFQQPNTFKRTAYWRFIVVVNCLLLPLAVGVGLLLCGMIYIGAQETLAGKHGVLIWGYISVLAMGAAGCLILFPMICVGCIRRWSTPLAVIDAGGIASPKDRPGFIAWNEVEKFHTWTSRGITRLTIEGKAKQQMHFWVGDEKHPLVNAVRAGYEAAQHSK